MQLNGLLRAISKYMPSVVSEIIILGNSIYFQH